MKIIKNIEAMHLFSAQAKRRGQTIGFVPTMGFLHAGHLSLIRAAQKKAGVVVVSIFVNPAQFGPKEDFKRYPRDIKRDIKLLKEQKVDVLFLPDRSKMYAADFKTFIEVKGLSDKMCGQSRPTHFRGVTTVVAKLFNIVMPDLAFFGAKDHQQLVIIQKMAEQLNFPVKIISLPIVREPDGLAMSSRNKYLNPAQRRSAARLYQALRFAAREIKKGERAARRLIARLRALLAGDKNIRLDYIVIADPSSLENLQRLKGKALIALAAYVGKTRLIDNVVVEA
jgi:pantoate--beta-alanine ligase